MQNSTAVKVKTYELVPISLIKPDPDQPRQISDYDEAVTEMAASIKQHGLIHPIELDDQNVIVTGEIRWRAARRAGLTEVPAGRINLSGADRYARQLTENLQRKDMKPLEIAFAVRKLKESAHAQPTNIAKMLGKADSWVADMLRLAGETPQAKKAVETGKVPYTALREADRFDDPDLRQVAREKLLSGRWKGSHTVRAIRQKLEDEPHVAMKLSDMDFVGSDEDNIRRIRAEVPTERQIEADKVVLAKLIAQSARRFTVQLDRLPWLEVPATYQWELLMDLRAAAEALDHYLVNVEEV